LAAGWDFALWAISPLLAWHRGLVSGSVAGARAERPLLILRQSRMRAEISARVRKYQRYYPEQEFGTVQNDFKVLAAMNFSTASRGYKNCPLNLT
jgi:hypothetical protein